MAHLLEHAQRLAGAFELSDEDVRRCSQSFISELRLGLREKTPSMCQIPTFVTQIAGGHEKWATPQGISLGVDLGGTNLRVCSVELHGDTTSTVLQSQLPVPPEIMVCDQAARLFSFIANRLQDFLGTYHRSRLDAVANDHGTPPLSLGFTFSFPAYQTALDSGILLRWTKGFDIADAVNQDVCNLLQMEIDILKLPVKVAALVNDAVGTVMSRAYSLPPSHVRPMVGAIFGTGTNGVYLQALSEVTKPIEGQPEHPDRSMFMSTEWGSFDNKLAVLPVTPYDLELNAFSVNPGDQMFEKRVSGMFLGELLGLAVLDLCSDDQVRLFRNFDSRDLAVAKRWSVDSSIVSVAEADNSTGLSVLSQKISDTLGIPEDYVIAEDAQAVKLIAHAIGTRAARLAGMAVGAGYWRPRHMFRHGTGKRGCRVDVAVDGSVVEHYPGFEVHMRNALKVLDGIGDEGESNIIIGHTKDGSSAGAAIIALLATRDI
ncbi:hexokinase hxk2 protein [Apiospora aurea]|uniref:Phosphotransferase n=1 Tax=Apiospora aurea TaxID=335848 RepID=A0ABR1QS73_9PEZI